MTPTEKLKPLSDQKTLIQFIASAELMGKLEELKNRLAHQNFEGRMDVLVDQLADIALNELKPALASKSASKAKSASIAKPVSASQDTSHYNTASSSKDSSASQATSNSNPAPQTPAPGMTPNTSQPPATDSKPVRSNMKSDQLKRSRYIPAKIRRQVILRDQNGCTYQDPKTGRVCGTKHGLQLDHIMPFSWGGEHSVDNLTLRCGAHNRFRAELMG